jgi:hypothetical protein
MEMLQKKRNVQQTVGFVTRLQIYEIAVMRGNKKTKMKKYS